MRDDGTLATRRVTSRGRLLHNFDRLEIEELARLRRDRLSAFALGREFGLAPYGAQQLIAPDLIEPIAHPWFVRRYGGAQTTGATLTAFRRRLAGVATKRATSVGPLVPLSLAMRGYGGGPKPWAEVMRAMLAGDLPFTTADGEINAATLLLPADAARWCWSLPAAELAETYSQLDALEIANLLPKHGSKLAILATEGAGDQWCVDGSKLATAVGDRMSHSELVARSGWDPAARRRCGT